MEFFRKEGSKQVQGIEELSAKILEVMRVNDNAWLTMVEVGSAYGESANIYARHFNEVHCIDPWIKSTADREKFFDEVHAEWSNTIKKHKGVSADFIEEYKDESLDFVYIDANHHYEDAKQDIEMWLPKIKKGGFIGGHDYNFKFLGVIQAVHETFDRPDWVFMDSSWLVNIK